MDDVWRRLCEYMKLWCWPLQVSQKAGVVAKLFEEAAVKKNSKEQKFRCSASEVLSLHQPLRHFLLRCCTVACDLPRRACLAWLRVLEILLHAPTRFPGPGELQACVEEALQLCRCWVVRSFDPKVSLVSSLRRPASALSSCTKLLDNGAKTQACSPIRVGYC